MSRYVLKMSKTGYIRYISHLDMMRLFKNAFKRAAIRLIYSQGFNPHPKMSFAQPLSLGYSSTCELLEFECREELASEDILNRMKGLMPNGIDLISCEKLREEGKPLAARVVSAQYKINIPIDKDGYLDAQELCDSFYNQEKIIAQKKQKKKAISQEVDIKPMIRDIYLELVDNNFIMYTTLNSGSTSNLSPELLIAAFAEFAGISTDRTEIDVERVGIQY